MTNQRSREEIWESQFRGDFNNEYKQRTAILEVLLDLRDGQNRIIEELGKLPKVKEETGILGYWKGEPIYKNTLNNEEKR